MDTHIRTLRKEELLLANGGWFDEENAERVVTWLVAAENRRPVVLIGAGFTRNALDQNTDRPTTQNQAPLWHDVAQRLASDLGIGAFQYDAPTLSEMYQEAFGDAALRDKLRSILDDSSLEPGPAHKSLAAYPCEAIVTTNCLDTVLDKVCGTGWRRVIVDADCSTSGRRRDLIYLHGHRELSDSWVITRSQYEDFTRTRPVVVARVRQLLAQHPWLIVGFSMGDPNFHALIRLLGVEMRGHQPLSLALMTNLPISAERMHWRRLGIEMAAPHLDKDNLAKFFAWVFPKLLTEYSPSSEAARAFIERGSTHEEKLRRFRLVNPPPIVDKSKVYIAWKEVLNAVLALEDRETAAKAAKTSVQAYFNPQMARFGIESTRSPVAASSLDQSGVPFRSRILEKLCREPQFAAIARDVNIRYLDLILQTRSTLHAELAEHFAWGLEHGLFKDARPPALMDLVAIHLAKDCGWNRERIDHLIYQAILPVRRYGRRDIEKLLDDQVRSIGHTLPSTETKFLESYFREAEAQEEAHAAYDAFMNANFFEAADLYERAEQIASAAGLDYHVWAYRTGRADALQRLVDLSRASAPTPGSEPERAHQGVDVQTLWDSIGQIEMQPTVKYWLAQANEHLQSTLRESTESCRVREWSRIAGAHSMRFSGSPYSDWKSYRDLQEIGAPPSLRRRYFEPLRPFFDINDATDVRAVLASAAKPQEWIQDFLVRVPSDLSTREERDKYVVDGILCDAPRTKSERLAALQCAGTLRTVFRTEDVETALRWLQATAQEFGQGLHHTAWGVRYIGEDCWAMFSAVARWADRGRALDTARILVEHIGDTHIGSAQGALSKLPWYSWKLTSDEIAIGYFELLTRLIPSHGNAGVTRRDDDFTEGLFALLQMVDAGLSADVLRTRLDDWTTFLGKIKQPQSNTTPFSEDTRAGFFLERQFMKLGLMSNVDEEHLFDTWFGEINGTSDYQDNREVVWTTLADALDQATAFDRSTPSLVKRLEDEVKRYIRNQPDLNTYKRNPHLAGPTARMLTIGLQHLETDRAEIASYLIELLKVAPSSIDYAAGAIKREFWDEDGWNDLKNVLVAACSGAQISARPWDNPAMPTLCQTAVLALVGKVEPKLRDNEPALWHVVQALSLGSVNDERYVIASHAAFAVVHAAMEVEDSAEATLYKSAIERIVADARVEVRSAVADAGIDLAKCAKQDRIRQAARTGIAELAKDDNAQIQWILKHKRVIETSNVYATDTVTAEESG